MKPFNELAMISLTELVLIKPLNELLFWMNASHSEILAEGGVSDSEDKHFQRTHPLNVVMDINIKNKL